MARAKIGDVFEIPLENGRFAYAMYTHEEDTHGPLIHVFEGTFDAPKELRTVLDFPVKFAIFLPINEGLRRKAIRIIGNSPVPEALKPFPLFRAGLEGPSGKVQTWFLWDGAKEWRVNELTEEQRKLPIREIPSFPMLQEMIATGWRPETDPR